MRWLRVVAITSCFTLSACADKAAKYPIPPQIAVYVAVSERVQSNDGGLVAAVIDGLEAELRDNGHMVQVIPAHPDEKPPTPRIELRVISADAGDMKARGTGNAVGGVVGGLVAIANSSDLELDCYWVPKKPGKRKRVGRWSGGSSGSWEDAVDEGESIGRSIADKLLD